jgi:anti-sigma factor RsiW
VHGTLSPSTRARVEAHVGACAPCRRELDLVRAAQAVLARTPSVDVGRVVSALPRPPKAGSPRAALPGWALAGGWRRAAAIATVVAAGAAVGVGTRDRWSGPSEPSGVARSDELAGARGGATRPSNAPVGGPTPASAETPQPPVSGSGAGDLILAAGVQELDDAQLDALLREIEALDGVPSEEPLPELPAFAGELAEGGV